MSERRTHAAMSAETRAKLLASARQAFGVYGYAGASMDAVCDDAGVTRGALYHHFGGKPALLEAVVREIDREMGEHLDAHSAAIADPWEALCACNVEYLRLALRPEIQQIVLRDAPAVLGQRLREIDQEGSIVSIVEALDALLADERIVDCDTETVARMMNGALVDAALWIAASDEPEARFESAARSIQLLMAGLELRQPDGEP